MYHEKECLAINPDTNFKIYPFSPEVISSRMQEVLISDHPEMNRIISYLLDNHGKMLRPRLVTLSAALYPHDPVVVRDAAVAVELIHIASLVHDDIIDNAHIRRGRESVNGLWGNQAGVLTGDYLFAAAFRLINCHGLQPVMKNITETIQIMCSGEIRQMTMAFDTNISEEDYYDKSYRKTARLFASSCRIGALVSSMPLSEVEILEQFGLNLGYAYQIIDDVLDFVSSSSLLGKPVGNDLLQGNITLPVIYSLQTDKYGPWLQTLLQGRNINSKKMQKVLGILTDTGALEYAINCSQYFLENGVELIRSLPPGPARQELENLARYLLEGYYQKFSPANPGEKREAAK